MFAILNDPIVRLFAAPFVSSLVLATLIRWIGAGKRGEQAAGAAVGIVFAWAAAYELGAELFPPSADDNNMFYLIAAGLIVGVPFDFFRTRVTANSRYAEVGLALLFGLAASYWVRGTLDIWTPFLLLAWGTIVLRIHIVAARDTPVASAMLALSAAGLGAAAWAAGLETNIAFQFAAAAAGYFLLNWIDPTMRFGITLILTGAGALMLAGLRLATATQAVVPALFILGFVFFADAPIRRLLGRRKAQGRWLTPLLTAAASLLPIALAALAAHIGINFEAS